MIINATDGSHRAVLTPLANGEGVEVELWQLVPTCHCLGRWVLACPWHVALDAVYAHVHPLRAVPDASLYYREPTHRLEYDPDLRRVVATRRK